MSFRASVRLARHAFESLVRLPCLLGLSLALAGSVSSGGARAAEGTDPAETPVDRDEEERPFRLLVGLKGGGGGSLWSEPGNADIGVDETGATFSLPVFDGTRAGYVFSGGLFVEAIIYEHLGLEVGLHFVHHTLLEDIDWSFTDDTDGSITSHESHSEQEVTWHAFNVPILMKGMIRTGNTRVWLGVGPELAFVERATSKFKITDGALQSDDASDGTFPFASCFDGKARLPGTRCNFERIGAKPEESLYLTVAFGIEIAVGEHFAVPIDLRWSYNLSQESDYLDRVEVDPDTIPTAANPSVRPSGADIKTLDSMFGELRIGFAYRM